MKNIIQLAFITVNEYVQSNKELAADIPGNSMTLDDYINMRIQMLEDNKNVVFQVDLFIEYINLSQSPDVNTVLAAIHYKQNF